MGLGIAGLCISIAYLILSSVEHFFKMGFGLAVFGLIASSLYCYFSWRTLKLQRQIHDAKTTTDKLKLSSDKRTSSKKLSKTTLLLMSDQLNTEGRQTNKFNRIFFIIYCGLVVLLMILISCRYATLIMRIGWRQAQTAFPTECGPWTDSAKNGCSRAVLQTSGCVNFSGSYAIVF